MLNLNEANCAVVKKVGRPCVADPLIFKTVGLTAGQWQWLSLWINSNPSVQLRELFSRAQKFWPSGPYRFR